MARTKQILKDGARLNDFISTGILAQVVPMPLVKDILIQHDRQTVRQRKLPREFLVYYVIAMALFANVNIRSALKAILEGLAFVFPGICLRAAGDAAISQGRQQLGEDVMRQLCETVCKPLAEPDCPGSWYKSWRLVAIDGSNFDLPDEAAIRAEYPKHSNGVDYPFPQLTFVALLELGSRCIVAAATGNDGDSEKALAVKVIPHLQTNMLLLGDRYYAGYDTINRVVATGAAFLFRVKTNRFLPVEERLPDGSYLTSICQDRTSRRRGAGLRVRVVEYRIKKNGKREPEVYRLVTSLCDWTLAPALELAELYCQRWGIETAFREMKSHLKLPEHTLRSKRPDLIRQEFWGFILAHYVVRRVMYHAARASDQVPIDLGFRETVQILKRRSSSAQPFPPKPNGDSAEMA